METRKSKLLFNGIVALGRNSVIPQSKNVGGNRCATSGGNCELTAPTSQCSCYVNSVCDFVVLVSKLYALFFGQGLFVWLDVMVQPFNIKGIGVPNSNYDGFSLIGILVGYNGKIWKFSGHLHDFFAINLSYMRITFSKMFDTFG